MRVFFAFFAFLVLPSITAAETPAPYDMYAILDVTGGSAFVGKAETQTLRAVEDVVNRSGGIRGRPIRYVIEDGQTNPVVVVQLFSALAERGVPVIAGPSSAAECQAVIPRATSGPVAFCLTGSVHSAPGSFVFGSLPSSGNNAAVAIRYLRSRGFTHLSSLNTTDASGLDGDNQIRNALELAENRDVTLVAAEHFNPTDISVSAQIARIKGAGAQVILCWATGTPYGTVIRSAGDAGFDGPIVTHSGNASNLAMEQFATILPRQAYFVGYSFLGASARETPAIRDAQGRFYESFRRAGIVPDSTAGQAWDAAFIAVSALRKIGTNATADDIRNYVSRLNDFPGINGFLDFRNGKQIGIGEMGLTMVRWDADRKVWIPVSRPGGIPL